MLMGIADGLDRHAGALLDHLADIRYHQVMPDGLVTDVVAKDLCGLHNGLIIFDTRHKVIVKRFSLYCREGKAQTGNHARRPFQNAPFQHTRSHQSPLSF